jgi:hypothetical protein
VWLELDAGKGLSPITAPRCVGGKGIEPVEKWAGMMNIVADPIILRVREPEKPLTITWQSTDWIPLVPN